MSRILLVSAVVLSMSFFISGCTTLSPGGSNVQLVHVSQSKVDVEKAEKNLRDHGCKFVKNIIAPIAWGNDDVVDRLIIGLKNKTAEVGGNAVISSLATHGFPIKTQGKVYNCPGGLKSNEV